MAIGVERILEEEGERVEPTALPGGGRGGNQPGQIEHERRGQRRVASLPGELHPHAGAEEPLERDVVPGRLPLAQIGDVVDVQRGIRFVAENLGEDAVLRLELAGPPVGIGQRGPVAAAPQVGP